MFAREGYALILGAFLLGAALIVAGRVIGGWLIWPAAILGLAVIAFTAYFFRDPSRTTPPGSDHLVFAPADGKVVEIVEETDSIFVHGPVSRISIFLSPLNVHVNRVPATGTVEHVNYVPGEYLVAWHPKASEKNERSEIGLRHPSGIPVLFKQIAGAVARRIVYHLEPGDEVRVGDRFGIVKFGSRMDIVLPTGTLRPSIQVGDRVTAGETVLGELVLDGAREGGSMAPATGTATGKED